MDKMFRIGDFCFRIISELSHAAPEHFLQFAVEMGKPEYIYHLREVQSLPVLDGKRIAHRLDIEVIQDGTEEARLIGIKGTSEYYACYQELSSNEAVIWVIQKVQKLMSSDTVFTSLFALERQMIRRQSLILHCAYIVYQGHTILFSAPSGTGKSTQAALWGRYRGSRTVNGDRALLRKIDGIWNACGWPVCGSSEICQKGDFPIHAIVMLRQGKENHVERLTGMQAFSQIYSQITMNQWNREFVMKAMELLDDLVKQIPIWQLTCDMTENAVKCLESVLFPASIGM